VFGLNGRVGSGYIARNAKLLAETVDVPMSVFAMAIPIGFGLILIHALAHLATLLFKESST
jgi:TRAP-type transport system small permease protein